MNKPFFPAEAGTAYTPPSTPWLLRGRIALLIVGLLWLEYVMVSLVWNWGSFATLSYRDPDDAMRMVQVRDFLAGQSWFDVSQHRVNPPHGGPMHWSRLVDMPIAGLVLALRPLVGAATAEIIASITVPFATLGVICLGLYRGLRNFLGVHRAVLSVALLVTCVPILVQVAPLRIDHHGWQIAMAALVLMGLLYENPRAGGWTMGLAMAMWLHISSEGLPFAALTGGILGLLYIARSQEWPRLIRYAGILAIGSPLLLLGTRGWTAGLEVHCDSMSPVYVAPLALLFPLLWAGKMVAGDTSMVRRTAPLAIGGIAAATLFLGSAGPCLAGPFETMDPLVYDIWYKGVLEGLPIWQQDWATRGVILLPSLFGIAGIALALRDETETRRRTIWFCLLALATGGLALAILVMRAMSFAHLFVLPGLAVLIARIYPRIAALSFMPARVILTVALCVLSPAGLILIGQLGGDALAGEKTEEEKPAAPAKSCTDASQVAALNAVPNATIFAPLDIGPAMLQRTGHSVIGTAHHRNIEGMTKVIRAFVSDPATARPIITGTSASYLLICQGLGEVKRYTKVEPNGLAAQLAGGKVPTWLKPVPVSNMETMRLYKIIR
ncbi:MAG: hypothetical protein R3E11_01965 [Sphingobium sp.]